MATAEQGDINYEIHQLAKYVLTNDVSIVINDSTAAPTLEDMSIQGVFLRIRTGGDMAFWNGSSWAILNKANILTEANSYANTVGSNTLASANAYTNAQVVAVTGAAFGGSVVPTSNPAPTVDTFYFATQAGTYTNMGGVVVSANSFAVISYKLSTTSWTISQTPLNLSNYVAKTDFTKIGQNILSDTYYILNKRLLADGTIANSTGASLYDKVPFSGAILEIGGWVPTATPSKNFYWFDVSNVKIGSNILLDNSYPITDKLTRPSNATSFSFNDIQASGQVSSHSTLFAREVILGGEQYNKLYNVPFRAESLSDTNKVPTPTNNDMAANKSYVDGIAVNIGKETVIFNNLANFALIQNNKVVDNTGAFITASNYKAIVIPIDETKLNIAWKNIYSLRTGGIMYGKFYNSSDIGVGALIGLDVSTGAEGTRAIPAGATKLILTIRSPQDSNDTGFANMIVNYGTTALNPYVPYSKDYASTINTNRIKAEYIGTGSICVDPLYNENVVNKKYVDENAVLNENIETETVYSDNLANPTLIVDNKLIDNTGAWITASGWKSIAISITDTMPNIAWKGINSLRVNLYGRFFNSLDVGVGTLISISPTGGAGTRAIPSTATKIVITIKAPEDSGDSGFDNSLMVNYGTVPIDPYVPYAKTYVTSINGNEIKSGGGGEAYDQSLNTTDDVEFESVTTPLLTASTLSIESFMTPIPIWDETGTPPINLYQAYLFVSGPNAYIKARIV